MLRRGALLVVLSFAPIVLVVIAFALYVYVGVRAGADAPTYT
jgi:hypothetical protein